MTTVNMVDQIKMLIELQEIDTEIFAKKEILEDIPERIKVIDEALKEKATYLKGLEEESKKLQMKRKEKEIELETKENTIKKYQTQLFQVKTNEEYSSLEKEIGGAKADSSVLEEEIIGLLDQIDEVRKNIAKEKEILGGEEKKAAEENRKIDAEKKQNEAEFNDLSSKRKNFAEKIEKNVLSKYERILHNREGLALVPVVGGACGGCNMNLPPQVINEAKLKSDLTFCGNCARILYSGIEG